MTAPVTWAQQGAAKVYKWPAERPDLEDRYRDLGGQNSRQLQGIFDKADELATRWVLLEAPYIDFDYRSEFSQHLSRRFNPPPDRNERLIFLRDRETAVGMCVLRPTAKPVGRTVMGVPARLAPYVSCAAPQVVRSYGQRHTVEGYPFISQDGEYGRCAHAAIWSVMRYLHLRHGLGRYSIAALVEATGTGQMPDKTVISSGLTVAEVRQALRRLGVPVLTYDPPRPLKGTSFERVMCQYLDSGFPVLLNTPVHLTVLVGYAVDSGGQVRWIRSNDNQGPYDIVDTWDSAASRDASLGPWQKVLVPLPGRLHVPAEAGETAARRTFQRQLGAKGGPTHLREDWRAEKITTRTYALEPAVYKEKLLEGAPDSPITRHYLGVPTPVWGWMTEFAHEDDNGKVLGSVLIDATSDKTQPTAVAADIDGWCVYYSPTGVLGRNRVAPGHRYSSQLPDRSWKG